MNARRSPVLALAAAVTALGLATGQVAAAVTVVWEKNLTGDMMSLSFPYNDAFEPIVATHPTMSERLAVVYQYEPSGAPCAGIVTGLRTSIDGGATWTKATGKPWAGSGRLPNYHGTIAWGPGPTPGSARIYWADTTVSDCAYADHRLSIAYSDNRGASWSPMFVAKGSAEHGYPDIVVDRNPASPNFGAVYATINPFDDTVEPGVRVLASKDFGAHWQAVNVPALPAQPGFPFKYRNGYRLRAAPDGSVYVSWCQVDRASANSGVMGVPEFGIARLRLDRSLGTFTATAPVLASRLTKTAYNMQFEFAPGTLDRQRLYVCWAHGIDVDPITGRIYLALPDYTTSPAASTPRGTIRLGRSDDNGQSWSWQSLPALAADSSGRAQSAHKPTLTARGGRVFVGFHVLTDVPLASGPDPSVTVGNAFTVSTNGGANWTTPRLVSATRWNPDWLDLTINGAGLRSHAELTASGRVFWAYGDGRTARAKPDSRWGRCQVFAALIDLG